MDRSTEPANEHHSSAEHRARSMAHRAKPTEVTQPGPRTDRSRIRRDLLLIAALVAVGIALVRFADIPNPPYAEARAIADRLDAAYATVWKDGGTLPEAATTFGLHLEEYSVGDRTIFVLTSPEASEYGFCYGLRIGAGEPTDAVRFRATEGCVPQGRSAFETAGTWSDVLGTERVTAVWFVPGAVLILGGLIAAATDIAITLITD